MKLDPRRRSDLELLGLLLCLCAALVGAAARAWTCDDAFISFRYAEHLVAGEGLVFNPGEYVEGFTNLLWTLWAAVAIAIGVDLTTWTGLWGIAAMLATLGVLWRVTRTRALWGLIPLAPATGAAMADWQIFATSGLETSAFALAVLGCCTAAASARPKLAAAIACAAILTRPEGMLVAALVGLHLWLRARRLRRDVLLYAAITLGCFATLTAFRLGYYGDFAPNTFWAKSSGTARFDRGLGYLWLFAKQYPALAIAYFGGVVLALRGASRVSRPDEADSPASSATLQVSVLVTTGYLAYLAYVGGDFMFARFIIPLVPLLLIQLDACVAEFPPAARAVVTLAVVTLTVAQPRVIQEWEAHHGVNDEWNYYMSPRDYLGDRSKAELAREQGESLRALSDVPCVALMGASQARAYYVSGIATVIDFYGLTDRTIARTEVVDGTLGHERRPNVEYLEARKVDFAFSNAAGYRTLADALFDGRIPPVHFRLGAAKGRLLRWHAPTVAAMRRAGAIIDDYPAQLDAWIADGAPPPGQSWTQVLDQAERFYFRHTDDPRRHALLRDRARRSAPGSGSPTPVGPAAQPELAVPAGDVDPADPQRTGTGRND